MDEGTKGYLTPAEVAARLRLSLRSVYRSLADGSIVGVRRGGKRGHWLVTEAAADAYLVSSRGPAPLPPTLAAQAEHNRAMERLRANGYGA